ncbi:MAG: hypothetical protein EXS13_09210 [Planctomycetes bacterium]|nr:hypothetical protein [Planctomycetota bacterium]
MGALAGVGEVKFDCKLATIRMAGSAALIAEVRGVAAGGAASVEAAFRRALDRSMVAELGADGRVIVRFAAEVALEIAVVEKAVRHELAAERATQEVELAKVTVERWPTTAERALVIVKLANNPVQRAKETVAVPAAIAALPNVLAVLPRADGLGFAVFTKERCENLATRVRERLAPLALELDRVELEGVR